jgi:hypothetical protein
MTTTEWIFDLFQNMTDTSLSNPLASEWFPHGTRGRIVGVCLLLGILAVPACGEKGTLETAWLETLAKDRKRLSEFEVWTETWRYEVFESSAPITVERSQEWVRTLWDSFPGSATNEEVSKQAVSFLVEKARTFFATAPEEAEVLSEVHQRVVSLGTYWVWERRSGALSKFDPQGTWHQSEGVIAIGPPVGPDVIEAYLARIGFLVPAEAKTLEVPSATPDNREEVLVLQLESEESLFKYGCHPWRKQGTRIDYVEEYPMMGEEEGTLSEKRYFFQSNSGMHEPEKLVGIPDLALEFRYGSRGELTSYAIIQIHPPVLDPQEWRPFPSARPPFGWKVLDYRFLPEKEFTFGDSR